MLNKYFDSDSDSDLSFKVSLVDNLHDECIHIYNDNVEIWYGNNLFDITKIRNILK